MTWNRFHSDSERLAGEANAARRVGDIERAEDLYRHAAQAETKALGSLANDKARTRGITATSAVALWYKGRDYASAEKLAHSWLATGDLPSFAEAQLRDLLSMVWSAQTAERGGVRFASGDVLVSVQGGLVAHGGAPLDLIVQKVEAIEAMLYRTVEMLLARPSRKRGGPPADIQTMFRPWLFQAPAGSYQFAVRIQEPPQLDIWPDARPKAQRVTETFFAVLRAAAGNPADELTAAVADAAYRTAFLKLARNLAPSKKGKTFDLLTVRDAGLPGEPQVSFVTETRVDINAAIRQASDAKTPRADDAPVVTFEGVLRGLQLDKDWIEIAPAGAGAEGPAQSIHIDELSDLLDDVVGPMVNKRVVVTAVQRGRKYLLRDIELDE